MRHLLHKHWSSFQIIIIGFFMLIFMGAFLLTLPVSSESGQATPFLNALFTATSSACVTGLIVYDTASYWSTFGEAVIIMLIQIGGMGVVTIAVCAAIISGRKIGLMQRSTMQEAISAPNLGGIIRFTGFIIKAILLMELIGMILMFPVFYKDFGGLKGVWYSVFHSISAFCNAGFDLMGDMQPFSSLTGYSGNVVINLVISGLIAVGGLGFLTWDDIRCKGIHIRKYRMQSKVILITTLLLIFIPFLYFFFAEFRRERWQDMSFKEKILASLFQAVTPRTAGFNTVDLTMLSEAGQMVMIILMLIGGSPGSTAGGMKTTTIAVLVMTMLAVFKRKENAGGFGRRIDEDTIKHAVTVLLMYLTLFIVGGMAISLIEDLPMLTCLYETASAIGTVGLTLGITPKLGVVSKIILIILMYLGRVGGLTLVYALLSGVKEKPAKLPKEKITVG